MSSDPPAPATPAVTATTAPYTCPRCHRDLEMRVEARMNGKVHIALVCPRHGSFPGGWKRKFLDATAAQVWAARRRAEQRQRR